MRSILRSSSLWACLAILLTSLAIRSAYFTNESKNGYNATTWDALGYYMYLPGYLIYDDVTELKWFPAIDSTYNVSGGMLYQATPLEKGGYAFKYLGGVALMEAPFFYIGHGIAHLTDAPEDGFSWPYQYAILFGAICWFFVGCLLLRKVLLRYYNESITTLTLLLLCLASNALQYVSVDGAMSHAFIFPLYAAMLWLTIRWHEQPKARTALFIGLVAGLATISRPTELIIIFIPILWGLDTTGKLSSKWALVKQYRLHILWAMAGGIVGILPQMLYWKHATGSWIYDVGSKWYFLNPWFRVLFGFEKGWFVYTPVAVLMVAGLFFLKGKPFRKAVITFCLLNIWIIISWSDWRYGASYSTRALVQSYPVFALALAALLERWYVAGWKRWLMLAAGAYLVFVNLFQIGQYNDTVLHYDNMNRKYYAAIYLDPHPTPLDYSLLDTDELLEDEAAHEKQITGVFFSDTLRAALYQPHEIGRFTVHGEWIKTGLKLRSFEGLNTAHFVVTCYKKGKNIKEKRFRLFVPRSKEGKEMVYEQFVKLPEGTDEVTLGVDTFGSFSALMNSCYYVVY